MDDSVKQRMMVAFVAFNIVMILFQFLFNFGDAFTWGKLFMGLVVAGVAGAIAFFTMGLLNR